MYLTRGANVRTSRSRTARSPEALYSFQRASACSADTRPRVAVLTAMRDSSGGGTRGLGELPPAEVADAGPIGGLCAAQHPHGPQVGLLSRWCLPSSGDPRERTRRLSTPRQDRRPCTDDRLVAAADNVIDLQEWRARRRPETLQI